MSESEVLSSSIKEGTVESSGIETSPTGTDIVAETPKSEVSSTQEDKTVEDPVAIDNNKIESDHDNTDTKQKTADKSEQKASRELKLLLELSKEANLDTNITYKRKSMDPNVGSPTRDPKRSMRSQNPEFVVKHQNFLSRVSHGGTSDPEEKTEKDDIKRKRRNSSSDLIIGGAIDAKTKKLLKPAMALIQNNKDGFCWRCHKDGVNISCETCPRSYHQKCLRNVTNNSAHWICPECVCILKAESTKTRSPAMKDMSLSQLCTLLKYAHKRMVQCNDSEPFMHPVSESEFPDYKKYIVHPMDLTKLEANIMGNAYGSTNAFEADAKWILHNSIIFNSYQSKLTSIAKAIIKICKQEMGEIQNCATCYLNANTKKDWFVEVCPKPHLLVWAKLKGFPYWPAKAMSTNSQGMVDVRFFGAHDRAWVPYRECVLFTKKDPNSNNQKKHEINECIKELEEHIDKLKEVYVVVNFPPYRTPYEPDRELEQLRMFLPSYNPNAKKSDDVSNALSTHRYSKAFEDSGSEGEEDREVRRHHESNQSRARSRSRSRGPRKISTPGRPKTPKGNAGSRATTPKTRLRQNSEHSTVSDTSRLSYSSDKPSKADDDHSVSDTSMDSTEQRTKPLDDKTFSTPNVVKISDKLIKKLTSVVTEKSTIESESQPSLSDIKQVILGDAVIPKSKPTEELKEAGGSREDVVETAGTGKSSNKENKDINNTKKNREDKQMDVGDDLLEEMYSEVVDDHHINGTANRKRKRSKSPNQSPTDTPPVEDSSHLQKKLVRLVDIDFIKKSKGLVPEKPEEQTPSVSLIQKDTNDETVEIKTEPISPIMEDEDNAKRQYFSALNILEKPSVNTTAALQGVKPTQRARKSFPKPVVIKSMIFSQTSSKPTPLNPNSTPSRPNSTPSKPNSTPSRPDSTSSKPNSTLSKPNATPSKPNATPSKPIPAPSKSNTTPLKLNQTPSKPNQTPSRPTKAVQNAAKKNGTDAPGGLVLVAQPQQVNMNNIGAVTVFPPNQTIALTGTISNPIFNMVQHPTTFANYLVTTPSIPGISLASGTTDESQKKQSQPTSTITKAVTTTTSNQTKVPTTLTQTKPTTNIVLTAAKPVQTSAANSFKPAQTSAFNSVQSTSSTNITTKPIQTTAANTLRQVQTSNVSNTFKPIQFSLNVQTSQPSNPTPRKAVAIVSTSAALPPLCSLSTSSTTNSIANNTHLNALLASGALSTSKTTEPDDSTFFTAPSDRLLKALTDVTSRQPPSLVPRPPGPLTANTDAGLPSSAGAVTSKVNGISHKLTDYFRSMLVELLTEFGTAENPEALITALKLENETLKVQHQQEVSELKKNLQTILKEVERNYSEDSKRLIDESRAQCEAEAIRRVDEAKMKQWCANCKKEAQFYCCWNTSYCDYPCQTDHWPTHMDKCTQNSSKSDGVAGSPKLASRKNGPPKALPGSSLLVKSPMIVGNPNSTSKQLVSKQQPGNAPKPIPNANSTFTIVEQGGNFELMGNGPISVGGKLYNINKSSTTMLPSGSQKIIFAPLKPTAPSVPTSDAN